MKTMFYLGDSVKMRSSLKIEIALNVGKD
jgi:hypothetical protein